MVDYILQRALVTVHCCLEFPKAGRNQSSLKHLFYIPVFTQNPKEMHIINRFKINSFYTSKHGNL